MRYPMHSYSITSIRVVHFLRIGKPMDTNRWADGNPKPGGEADWSRELWLCGLCMCGTQVTRHGHVKCLWLDMTLWECFWRFRRTTAGNSPRKSSETRSKEKQFGKPHLNGPTASNYTVQGWFNAAVFLHLPDFHLCVSDSLFIALIHRFLLLFFDVWVVDGGVCPNFRAVLMINSNMFMI